MRRASLGDFLGHEARNAINDIRQKVFEEAFFGRATTARPVIEISRDHEPEKSRTLEEIWGGPSPRAERP